MRRRRRKRRRRRRRMRTRRRRDRWLSHSLFFSLNCRNSTHACDEIKWWHPTFELRIIVHPCSTYMHQFYELRTSSKLRWSRKSLVMRNPTYY
jgi:hypothetical protein